MGKPLDSDFNRKPPRLTDNFLRKSFPPPIVLANYIVLGAGVVSLLAGYAVLGIILCLVGGFVIFTKEGVDVDTANKLIRRYTSFYGIKKGTWIAVNEYPFVCLFKSKSSFRINRIAQNSLEVGDVEYDVYLLNRSHRDRFLVKTTKTEAQAKEYARQIAKEMDLEFVLYAPQAFTKKTRR
ncbi:MAG TPA: hypothetical protein VNZ86_06505 [Bacteroidia bacterium]|jgi:hypothetical protein|nr:hypothetical protein [Bacteroidia bacterium]